MQLSVDIIETHYRHPFRIARKAEAEQAKSDWQKQQAELVKLAVTIQPRSFGDNSYVIRFTGVTPDMLGAQGSLYSAWLRKGNVLISIEMGGNFPEKFMADAMNKFLGEAEARFISFDAAPAKRP